MDELNLKGERKMAKGYVYILTNPCIQYTYVEKGRKITISPVKIGMAKDVEKRIGTLNTSLPENFVHHMSVYSDDPKAVENVVHDKLEDFRILTKGGERTEFFRCSVELAVSTLKRTARIMHLKEHRIKKTKVIGRSSSKIKSNAMAAASKRSKSGNVWTGKTQLAKIIARRGGNEGAFGGILQYFSRLRPCTKESKWRVPLEKAGIKFDKHDYVSDWTCAKNPM